MTEDKDELVPFVEDAISEEDALAAQVEEAEAQRLMEEALKDVDG